MTGDVLIIEDEPIIALDLAQKIRKLGYSVSGIASDSGEALDLAEKKRPALALVDIKLKGTIDGIEIARILKERFSTRVVFVTAYSDDEVKGRAMEVNPDGYLLKPINKADFEKIITSILS